MAEAGFYFTPNEKYSDCCTCYRCGIKVFNWLPDDTPMVEHKKLSPACKEVKSWTDVPAEDPSRQSINREQTDIRLRSKLADKAKRITGAFHRKQDVPKPSEPMRSMSKESEKESAMPSDKDRTLNDEEKLAAVRRQREVAEKSLEGLERLASAYPQGSAEQKRTDQSIVLQTATLEKLRNEESQLESAMGSLSFGRSWNAAAVQESAPEVVEDDESPVSTRQSQRRALPMLPSQMMKNSMPSNPTHIKKSSTAEAIPSYEQYQLMARTSSQSSMAKDSSSEWMEYFTDAGVPYYYSTITQKTVWQIPTSSPAPPMSPVS